MGAVLSCTGPGIAAVHLEEFQNQLESGDVLWFKQKHKSKPYMARGWGRWRIFSNVGFVVRTGPGPCGLQLYITETQPTAPDAGTIAAVNHSMTPVAPVRSEGTVVTYNLQQHICSDKFTYVAVSRLNQKLSDAENKAVLEYSEACSKKAPGSAGRTVKLYTSKDNWIVCNELVAEMLGAAGRVVQAQNMYGPSQKMCTGILGRLTYVITPSSTYMGKDPAQGNRVAKRSLVTGFMHPSTTGHYTDDSDSDSMGDVPAAKSAPPRREQSGRTCCSASAAAPPSAAASAAPAREGGRVAAAPAAAAAAGSAVKGGSPEGQQGKSRLAQAGG